MTPSTPKMHPFPAEPTQIIWVEGSDRQMGQQHAAQLGEKITQGMAPFYTDFFERMTQPAGLGRFESMGLQVLLKGLDEFLIQKLIQRIPDNLKERMRGLAEASELDEKVFFKAFVLPDLLPMLQAYWIRLKPNLGIPVLFPSFGCSSFVSKSSSFFHGRNLDFPGVAYWDRYPVLQVTRPKGKLTYLAITSAGVPLGGISGVNELGISVALHQHYTTHTHRGGFPPFVITEKILSEARSLEDALDLLGSHPLASSWAFVVADGQTKNAFIYEATPQISGIRWLNEEGNVLSHSNYFQSKNCKDKDYATTERMNWDNFWRRETLDTLIRKDLDKLDVDQALLALSDHTDGFWGDEKIVNRTVSQVYNIQSYLIDFSERRLYLAEGDCPIHLQKYREFDLDKLFAGDLSFPQNTKSGYQFQDASKKRAKEDYILSFVSAFDGDYERAFEGLQSSLKHSFTPEAGIVAALVNFRLGGSSDASLDFLTQGQRLIENKIQNLGKTLFPPEYFEILLYQARAFDLKGNHSEAIKIYKRISEHPNLRDPNIRKVSKEGRAYSPKRVKRLIMPYSTYIPFD